MPGLTRSATRPSAWAVADERKAGIVCSGMNGDGRLEMTQLFAEEVMPHSREDAHDDETAGVGR
jgi:hypothetical protein